MTQHWNKFSPNLACIPSDPGIDGALPGEVRGSGQGAARVRPRPGGQVRRRGGRRHRRLRILPHRLRADGRNHQRGSNADIRELPYSFPALYKGCVNSPRIVTTKKELKSLAKMHFTDISQLVSKGDEKLQVSKLRESRNILLKEVGFTQPFFSQVVQ